MLKFRNKPTTVDNIRFASQREAKRYSELKLLERAGKIITLTVHPAFPLDVNGVLICRYVSDFRYIDVDTCKLVVEDVKSPVTRKHPVYRIKAKLFAALKGFSITEV